MRLAFIDADSVSALNAAVAAQDQSTLALQRELERMRSDWMILRSALSNDARSEPPPPHY